MLAKMKALASETNICVLATADQRLWARKLFEVLFRSLGTSSPGYGRAPHEWGYGRPTVGSENGATFGLPFSTMVER